MASETRRLPLVLLRSARLLSSPPVFGSIYLLALLWLGWGELAPPDETLFGKSAKDISNFVAVRFAAELRHIGATLLLVTAGGGIALGLVAIAILAVRGWVQRRRPAFSGIAGVALVVLGHAVLLGASMARWPQLYARAFYDAGGLRAACEVATTDLGARAILLGGGAALLLWVAGHPRRWSRRTIVVPVLAAVGLAGSFVRAPTAAPVAPAPARTRRPNIVVLASDGLRFDRLVPRTAPRLAAVADRGTRFDRAYVTLPRTFPSWTTMLTGQFAWHHGIRSSFARHEETQAVHDTLGSRLRAAGYRTAVVSDYAGDVFPKADFGFDVLRTARWDFVTALWQRGIEQATPVLPLFQTRPGRAFFPEVVDMPTASDPRFVADDAIATLRQIDADPFFLVVFFSTTHFPYAAPAPYFARFTDPAYRGPYRYAKTVGARVSRLPDAADVAQIRGLYDGAVAAVDDAAGAILDELARRGHADDTIVVVTSDHGETLFEHDRWHGHGAHLFGDDGVHVPLAIFDPRTPDAHHEDAVVSNVDFAATLAELAGIAPPDHGDGRSLAPAVRGERIPGEIAFSETELWLGEDPALPAALHLPSPPLFKLLEVDEAHGSTIVLRKDAAGGNLIARHRMARDARFKLLYLPTPTGIVWRLHDTAADPDELVDVQDRFPEDFARLKRALLDWLAKDPALHVER